MERKPRSHGIILAAMVLLSLSTACRQAVDPGEEGDPAADAAAVAADKAGLDIGDAAFGGTDYARYVSAAFTLPVSGENGSAIAWTASPAGVLSFASDGQVTVTRPLASTAVTLTARLSKGSASDTKNLEVLVKQSYESMVGREWRSIDMSSDGMRIAAIAENGKVWLSFDAGETWAETSTAFAFDEVHAWRSIAMTPDGTKLVAVGERYNVMTSSDSGQTFRPRPLIGLDLKAAALSSDGAKIVCAGMGADSAADKVQFSSNNGASWTEVGVSINGQSVFMSADGGKIFSGDSSSCIRGTAGSEGTWTVLTNFAMSNDVRIAGSSDGTKLVAVVYMNYPDNSKIFTSSDSGATWTERYAKRFAYAVDSDASGTVMAAVVKDTVNANGKIYTSSDSGATWSERDVQGVWTGVAVSADGSTLAAAQGNSGNIYTSPDGGVTWYKQF